MVLLATGTSVATCLTASGFTSSLRPVEGVTPPDRSQRPRGASGRTRVARPWAG